MDGTHPRIRLEQAEAADGYLAAVASSHLNRQARAGCSYIPFFASPDRVERLLGLIDEIPLLEDADIVIMHKTADNGYPHTRPQKIVCLPVSHLDAAEADLAETLRHEAVHLHQRANPHFWYQACLREGWTPVARDRIPQHLLSRCRINPDTFQREQFWSWDIFHVPLPLFTPKPVEAGATAPLTLEDTVVKWFDLRDSSLSSTPPTSFSLRYGPRPPQPEHPLELLAVEAAAAGITSAEELERKLGTK
jgi:hypothetical protein